MPHREEPPAALTRNALIPASIAVCFVLVYVVEVRPFWVFPIGLLVMGLYLLAPRLGKRGLARFDRDAVQLLSNGRSSELDARYRRAIAMRLFEAPARVAERRGLVAAESGTPDRARDAYLEALEGYGAGEAPLSVRLGLAHACYALGDDEEAIRGYRAVRKDAPGLPQVEQRYAHALARHGEDLDEAERVAAQLCAKPNPSAEAELVRALIHAKRGEARAARALVTATRSAEGTLADGLRREIDEALGAP